MGRRDLAVYRPSTGVWYVQNQAPRGSGASPGDIPVPGDYNGDGVTDRAVYRPSTGDLVRATARVPDSGGPPATFPYPVTTTANGVTDRAVFRPSTGTWYVQDQTTVQWGLPGDFPASRAYVPR